MASTYQRVRRHNDPSLSEGVEVEETKEVVETDDNLVQTKAQMVVSYITGTIVTLLALRFILALFGANASNAFVSAVYGLSAPLLAPFQGLFTTTNEVGVARLESNTLFAALIYVVIGVAIVKLIDIFSK